MEALISAFRESSFSAARFLHHCLNQRNIIAPLSEDILQNQRGECQQLDSTGRACFPFTYPACGRIASLSQEGMTGIEPVSAHIREDSGPDQSIMDPRKGDHVSAGVPASLPLIELAVLPTAHVRLSLPNCPAIHALVKASQSVATFIAKYEGGDLLAGKGTEVPNKVYNRAVRLSVWR